MSTINIHLVKQNVDVTVSFDPIWLKIQSQINGLIVRYGYHGYGVQYPLVVAKEPQQPSCEDDIPGCAEYVKAGWCKYEVQRFYYNRIQKYKDCEIYIYFLKRFPKCIIPETY